jgi:hypothetical protein
LELGEEFVSSSLKKQQKSVIWFHEQKIRILRLCHCIKYWPYFFLSGKAYPISSMLLQKSKHLALLLSISCTG